MSIQRGGTTETRPLEILGISEAEEHAYRWLLAHPGATVPEIAHALALTPGKTQRLVDTIEAKGLTTHAPERPRRYIPSSPDVALEALALQHHQAVQRARSMIQDLQEQTANRCQNEQEQIVELITSRGAEQQIFEQIQQTAQQEIIALIRPPVLISRLDIPHEEDQCAQREAQARGVRCRSIVDMAFLSVPGAVDGVRSDIKAGEEVKVFPSLPFKLFIADRRIGLIPLVLEEDSKHFVLLARSSPLLDALYALFEMFWERAVPISFTSKVAMETSDPVLPLSKATEDLISLMATGLNDKKIAAELHISTRTLERRVVELMHKMGTHTRFQTGWFAALRLSGANFPSIT